MTASLVKIYCGKLGIYSDNVLKKAEEMVRMVELKSGVSSLSSSSIVVMAIDMAAVSCSHSLDKNQLIKLSGIPEKKYKMNLLRIEQSLQPTINSTVPSNSQQKHLPPALSTLSVSCGLSEAEQFAAEIIKQYQATAEDPSAINPTLLNSAALFSAAKALKIRADKGVIVGQVGVKRALFDRLLTLLQPITNTLASQSPHKKIKMTELKTKENKIDDVLSNGVQTEKDRRDDVEEEEEDYYVWKGRILTNARKILAEKNRDELMD